MLVFIEPCWLVFAIASFLFVSMTIYAWPKRETSSYGNIYFKYPLFLLLSIAGTWVSIVLLVASAWVNIIHYA
jgi:hypothetical protein